MRIALGQVKESIGSTNEELDDLIEKIELPMRKDEDIDRVEIIVLKYKSPEIEKEFLQRIVDFTTHPYKLTFFDNRKNTGNTSKAWNKLLKESTCPYVVIMDTDALVTPCWLEPLVADMKNIPDCGMVGPVSGGPSTTNIQNQMPGVGLTTATDGHISGYCFMVNKKMLKELGYFDERFYIFGQDSDMCNRIHSTKGKWRIYVEPSSLVYHGKDDKFSYSTRKADAEKEFDWELDSQYAQKLVKLKNMKYEGTNLGL